MKLGNELIAVVKFNQGEAFVLSDKVEFKYQQHGNLIIGIDDSETFLDLYVYERPTPSFKAFGGHEFDIQLENGEVIHCNGQWWSGGIKQAEHILGKEITNVTYKSQQELKDCYVFTGCCAIKEKLEALRETYDGVVYEYREYEQLLKG